MPALHELYFHDVQLKQLQLQNFRGFGNVMLDFRPGNQVTVLIADNGGGKSTILDALSEFLRRFLHLGIFGKGEKEPYQTPLSEKDIFNERNNVIASAVLNLAYPYPDKEVFEWMNDCAQYLDEHLIEGKEATIELEGEIWTLQLKQQGEESITYYLPDEFQQRLDAMVNDGKDKKKVLSGNNLGFKIASYDEGKWHPNLSLSVWETNIHMQKGGSTELEFQLRRGRPDPMEYSILFAKPTSYSEFKEDWENNQGYIADFTQYTNRYDRYNPFEGKSNIVLPLLVYYGGSTINTRYDGELKLPYKVKEFQAYQGALEPKRFDFEEFLSWAFWVNEKQQYAWKRVKDTILDVMNADQVWYEDIRIEAQTLVFYKRVSPESAPIPVEVFQLSDGEKNIMALVGDLAKRAVQLNAVLFKVDVEPESDTFSNPLEYTPGIVLIDEIDLHLHPRWQRVIVPKLREHFPKVQFVMTTHSPLVLQEVDGTIMYLSNFSVKSAPLVGGWKIDDILGYMGMKNSYSRRNYEELVENFYDHINASNAEEAAKILDKILVHLPENSSFGMVLKSRLESLNEDWL
jgi:predicted ATP-binding protein involved in virulence